MYGSRACVNDLSLSRELTEVIVVYYYIVHFDLSDVFKRSQAKKWLNKRKAIFNIYDSFKVTNRYLIHKSPQCNGQKGQKKSYKIFSVLES